jgi:hypothetical protein
VLEGMGFASFIRAAAEQTERLDRLFPLSIVAIAA